MAGAMVDENLVGQFVRKLNDLGLAFCALFNMYITEVVAERVWIRTCKWSSIRKKWSPLSRRSCIRKKMKPSVRICAMHVTNTSWSLKGKRLSFRRKRNDCTLNPTKPLYWWQKVRLQKSFLKPQKELKRHINMLCSADKNTSEYMGLFV